MNSRRSNSSGRTPIGRFLASRQAARLRSFEQLEARNLMVAQIDVRLAVVDTPSGTPLTQLEINQDYFLEAFVKDVRAVPQGVQSAYVDVSYDATRVGNLGALVHGSDFNDVTRGIVGASLLDDGGGQDTDFSPPAVASQESLLFRLPFRAILSGTLTFTGAPSQNALFPTTMFGAGSTPVPDADFVFENVSILVNSSPTITSDGGGISASVSVAENTTAVTTVTATDPDVPADTISYSIVGGADQTHFTIDSSTGVLAFVTAPNFESPTDVGANNVYDVVVQAADGNGGADQQTLTVTVTGVNEPPTITSNGGDAAAAISVAENTTAVATITATDPDLPAQTLSYSLAGGADQAAFTINASTGALTFNTAPNFESPADSNSDNVYQVVVQVSDGAGGTDQQSLSVTVTNANDAPTITSNGGGATASVSIPENTSAVTTVVATDIDVPAQTLTYTIVGGADQTAFALNGSTGALTFVTPPNFESPTDAGANNVYEVIVQAADGAGGVAQQTISVTVTDANDAPIITSNGGGSTAAVSVPENSTSVTTVTATDADTPAQTLTYSIVGGVDQSAFAINASTGVLSFTSAPNFENPTDLDTNNEYVVVVQVADTGGGLDQQTLTVTVTNQNEAPDITSAATVSVPENSTDVLTVTATDPDFPAQTLTYSLTGGADQSRFAINASTGVLTFVTAPDFEAPTDVGANNVYEVIVQVSDGAGGTDQQAIAVTVTDVNDPPVITSNGGGATAGITVVTGNSAVTTVTATDQDVPAQTLTYTLIGGLDQADFQINASTGVLTFVTAPDFDAPADSNLDNVYEVVVQVADGAGGVDSQTLTVTVVAVTNTAPVITSNGGGASAAVSVAENTTVVTTNTATDSDVPAQTLTWSLVGGDDQAKFTIDASTGVLSFVTAPNFESPTDANSDNVYVVVVRVTDTLNTFDEQTVSATVTNANDPPVIASSPSAAIDENTGVIGAVTATDEDAGTTLTYSIVGGADANLFTISSSTGVVSFVTPPDFEEPNDANGDGVYQVAVQVSDGAGGTATQTLSVTVNNVNDPPIITSGSGSTASVSVPENTTTIGAVTALDEDVPAQTITYSLVGGEDQSLFTINSSTGALSFVAPQNFEAPGDANTDNVYVTVVQASDGQGGTDTQTVSVTVTNVNEAPTITSNGGGDSAAISVAENTTAVTTVTATDQDVPAQTLTFSISGGADASRFSINATTGVLTFTTAPNFETPTDTGANNVYDVIVQVADSVGAVDRQTLAVTVTNANDAPTITSNGGGDSAAVSVAENTTAVTTVTATDQDVPAQTLTFSLVGGADQSKFTINATTGALAFTTAPNFESPTDVGANNVYDVIVQVSDGQGGLDQQTIAVTVTNGNEAPVVTVPAAQTTNEDTALVFSSANSNGISVADPDSTGTFQITLTATNGAVTLASTTGITITTGTNGSSAITFTGTLANVNAALNGLSLLPTANFAGAGTLTVAASDGTASDTKSVSVTTAAINDAPTNTVPGAQTTPINTARVFSTANGNVISIADVDAGSSPMLVTLAVTSGTGTLTLSQTTGLTFATGDGSGDATMSFQGTIANVNAALNGLSFTPTTAFQGASTLTITTNDQGATGTGGALQDTDTVAIAVDPSQGTISGFVYLDADNDGVKDATEIGLGGVTVTLTGTVNNVAIATRTATTGSDGSYSFTQLAGGTYAVQETQPTSMVDGLETAGSSGGTVGADQITAITITGTATSTGNNFGERGLRAASISRRLFLGSTTTTSSIVTAAITPSSNSNGAGGEGESNTFSAASLLSSSAPTSSTANNRIANPNGALASLAIGEGSDEGVDEGSDEGKAAVSEGVVFEEESRLAAEPIVSETKEEVSDTSDTAEADAIPSEADTSGEGDTSGESGEGERFEPLLVGVPTATSATTVADLAGPITLTTEQAIQVDNELVALQRQGIQLEFDDENWSVGATVIDSTATQSEIVSPFDAHAEDDDNDLLEFVAEDVIAVLASEQ